FFPLDRRPVPAILRMGPYGRAFGFGHLVTDKARQRSEVRENAWFLDHSSGVGVATYAENLTSVDAFAWVPRGYAVVRLETGGPAGHGGFVLPRGGSRVHRPRRGGGGPGWAPRARGPRGRGGGGDDQGDRRAAAPAEPAGDHPVGDRRRFVPRARLPRRNPP